MGLFDKKYCDVCGEKIGLLGNRKLEDGNLCKNCAKKLSPWFDERRRSTIEQIKEQLAYREANRAEAIAFRATKAIGRDSMKLYVDDNARRFTVSGNSDFGADNPDILDFSQAIGCDLDIRENRNEIRTTIDGRSQSYNPPRYEYSYDFKVTIRVDHPYFKEMRFRLNGRSVRTGENRMSGSDFGAWNMNRANPSAHGFRGSSEYNKFIQLGGELKAMIDEWKNGASAPAQESPQTKSIRFGSAQPVPYSADLFGNHLNLQIVYSGITDISAIDPSLLQSCGGLEAIEDTLRTELLTAANEAVYNCGVQGVSFSKLPTKMKEIEEHVKSSLREKWASRYGVAIDAILFTGITLTEESLKQITEITQAQTAMMQSRQQVPASAQESAQPQPAAAACPFCGTPNPGKFCPNCGAKQA